MLMPDWLAQVAPFQRQLLRVQLKQSEMDSQVLKSRPMNLSAPRGVMGFMLGLASRMASEQLLTKRRRALNIFYFLS